MTKSVDTFTSMRLRWWRIVVRRSRKRGGLPPIMGLLFEGSRSGLVVCLGLGLRHLVGVSAGAWGEGRGCGCTGSAGEMSVYPESLDISQSVC